MEHKENNTYQITNCYKEAFPKSRFVGIKYKNSDRVNGMYGYYWEEWHKTGKFQVLEQLLTDEFISSYAEARDYIGLMRHKDGADQDYFEYWIGMYLPENTPVPEGYDYIDFSYDSVGICWVQGAEHTVFMHEGECYHKLVDSKIEVKSEADGGLYFFERYHCRRFTTPAENGEIILDIGFFVK